MVHLVHFLISHPVAMLAATIVLEQAGVPIASAPVLLLIGALADTDHANVAAALCVAVIACTVGDCIWFELGRRRKVNPRRFFTRLRPADSNSFQIAHLFARHGGAAMFVVRFLPGPNLPAAMAGCSGISRLRFVLQDTIVSTLWTVLYLAAGRFLPQQLRSWVSSTVGASPGWGIFLILGCTAAILCALKFRHRLHLREGIACPEVGFELTSSEEQSGDTWERRDPSQNSLFAPGSCKSDYFERLIRILKYSHT